MTNAFKVDIPLALCPLANANLVVGHYGAYGIRLVELDNKSNVVWEAFPNKRIYEIHECFPLLRFGFDRGKYGYLNLDSLEYRCLAINAKNAKLRQWSASALGEIHEDKTSMLRALEKALLDLDDEVRQRAADSLWKIRHRSN